MSSIHKHHQVDMLLVPSWLGRLFTAKNAELYGLALLLIFISNGLFNANFVNVPVTLFQLSGVALGLFFVWRYIPQLIAMLLREWSTSIILILVGASIFWSIAPNVSLEPIIWFYLTTFVGLYIALRFSLEEQLWLLIIFSVLSLMLSLFFIFVIPQVGVHTDGPHVGLWRGIYLQKNILGRYLSVGMVLLIGLGKRMGYWRWLLGVLLSIGMWGTGSSTALLTTIIMLLIIPILPILRLRLELAIGVILLFIPIVLIAIIVVVNVFPLILETLGKDATLSGRTELWSAAVEMIKMRPLTGWGFQASFSEKSPIFTMISWQDAPYAHNHWLDLTLELGIFAGVAYGFGLLLSTGRAIIYIRKQKSIESFFPLVFLVQTNIMFLSTQSIMGTFNVFWIMYVAVVYGLAIHDVPNRFLPFRRPYHFENNPPQHIQISQKDS